LGEHKHMNPLVQRHEGFFSLYHYDCDRLERFVQEQSRRLDALHKSC
jgi:hypothetical protein